MKKYIYVIGRIASGKSTYAKYLADQYQKDGVKACIIELGDIVRKIRNNEKRFFDAGLNGPICTEVANIIKAQDADVYIIASARALGLIDDINSVIGITDDQAEYYFMHVPYETCKARYEDASRNKDVELSYDEALKGDESIGMEGLMQEMYFRVGLYDNVHAIDANFQDVIKDITKIS